MVTNIEVRKESMVIQSWSCDELLPVRKNVDHLLNHEKYIPQRGDRHTVQHVC
jgi:hypothetical protein